MFFCGLMSYRRTRSGLAFHLGQILKYKPHNYDKRLHYEFMPGNMCAIPAESSKIVCFFAV